MGRKGFELEVYRYSVFMLFLRIMARYRLRPPPPREPLMLPEPRELLARALLPL
jgi:hypothetical protein